MQQPPQIPDILTYVWVGLLAIWGGIVSFLGKLASGNARPFNLIELIGEITTSGFAGVLTFLMCSSANVPLYLTAFLVGISGHMGSRGIFLLESWVQKKLEQMS